MDRPEYRYMQICIQLLLDFHENLVFVFESYGPNSQFSHLAFYSRPGRIVDAINVNNHRDWFTVKPLI